MRDGVGQWRSMWAVAALAACGETSRPPIPVLTSVEPSRAQTMLPVPVTLHGQNFYLRFVRNLDHDSVRVEDAFSVLLLADDGTEIALEDVSAVDDTTLKARVPAHTPTALYAARLKGPYGTSPVLPAAFEVLPPCDDGDADGICDASDSCVDVDGDGFGDGRLDNAGCFSPEPDCDDFASNIRPGAPELADDGVDQDCDGFDTVTCYADGDGDGFGSGAAIFSPDGTCASPALSPLGTDCDDSTVSHWADCGTCTDADDDDHGAGCDLGDDCDDSPATGTGCQTTCSLFHDDTDDDGYGDATSPLAACVVPFGFVPNALDCDPTSEAHWSDCGLCLDTDADGFGEDCDLGQDCDDLNGACFVGCRTYFDDGDGDTYGDPATPFVACAAPPGYVANNGDCDPVSAAHWSDCGACADTDGDTYGAGCDLGIDCDDSSATGTGCHAGCSLFYDDTDGDGVGNTSLSELACVAPAGFVAAAGDCDPASPTHWSDCGVCVDVDGDAYGSGCNLGSDCDDALATGAGCHAGCSVYYDDTDGDGFGDPALRRVACATPAGYVANNGDCDPSSNAHWNDCGACIDLDGDSYGANCALGPDCDDDAVTGVTCHTGCTLFFSDADADGYGDATDAAPACVTPSGYVANADDCDPASGAHWSDCGVCVDADGDDYGADCNSGIDCDDSLLTGASCHQSCSSFYRDEDGDSFGDPAAPTTGCTAPTGYVADDTDCDDSTATGAPCHDTCSLFYPDLDGDGYGDPVGPLNACAPPSGYVANSDDCDDVGPCGIACAPNLVESPIPGNCADTYDNDCDSQTDLADLGCTGADLCQYVTWATFAGPGTTYLQPDDATDPPAKGQTWAQGDWSTRTAGELASFSSGGRSGVILAVEAVANVTLDEALVDDTVRASVWFDGAQQGSAVTFARLGLNQRVGKMNAGLVAVDVTAARAWSWADLDGALGLRTAHTVVGANEGRLVYLDTVGFRVTHSCNSPPSATFAVNPAGGAVGTTFTVDASAVSDAEDPVAALEVRWDWEGDGTWDTAFSTTKAAAHAFGSVGVKTIVLEVRDSAGESSWTTHAVAVSPGSSSVYIVSSNADSGTGTLREALGRQGSNPAPETIIFASPMTIVLASELPIIDQDLFLFGGGSVTIDGNNIDRFCLKVEANAAAAIVGLEIRNCRKGGVFLSGASGTPGEVVVRDCRIHNNGGDGLSVNNTNGVVVGPGNDIYANGGNGIYLQGSTDNFVVRGNRVHDNAEDGLFVDDLLDNGIIEQNQMWRQVRNIKAGNDAKNGLMRFNSLVAATSSNVWFANNGCTGWRIQNNVFTDAGLYGINPTGAPFAAFSHNLFFANDSGPTNGWATGPTDVLLDPLFVDPTDDDYRLQGASPALNAGVDLGVDVNGPAPGLYNGAAPELGAIESP